MLSFASRPGFGRVFVLSSAAKGELDAEALAIWFRQRTSHED
jgi:hypothetical protein